MAQREYIRNGHIINIDVDEGARERWHWSYTIDVEGYTEMRDRPRNSEGVAMLEAEQDANAKADRMPPGGAVE